MCLEYRAPGPLLRLDLCAAGCVVVRVGRAQELLDEELAAAPLGERPFTQASTDDLEVLEDSIAVENVTSLHEDASRSLSASVRRWSGTPRLAGAVHSRSPGHPPPVQMPM